jgi:hypothetical protein
MSDEEYISPAEVRERLVKTDRGFYWRTQLEVYQARGWLNLGYSSWEDRKRAAEILATSHHIGFGEPIGAKDMSRPQVDGHGAHYVSEVALFNQEVYQNAMKAIKDRLIRAIIRVVLIEDKTVLYPESAKNWRIRKKNLARRQMLCQGLDILVRHYMPKFKRKGITGFSKVKVI